MATPPPYPPYGFDPRDARRWAREQRHAQKAAFRAQRHLYRAQFRTYRRGSILGPLLLVSLGVLFLLIQTGRVSFVRTAELFARWWPLLFIAAGVIVLIEWGIDQVTHREEMPYVRRGVGGGVVFLLILAAVAGGAIHMAHDRDFLSQNFSLNPDNLAEFLGDRHEADQTADFDFNPGASLTVDNPHGDVTISGTSDDNRIHVQVHKQVFSTSEADAKRKLGLLDLRNSSSGGANTLTVTSLDGASANLAITVPSSAVTTVTANHGDIHVSGIHNSVMITANHGDVELSGITGPVTARVNQSGSSFSAHSITGAVELKGHAHDLNLSGIDGALLLEGEFYGNTHIEHIKGPVGFSSSRTQLRLARLDGEIDISPDSNLTADQAVGPFTLTTRNRNITLDRIEGDVKVVNRNGTVDLTSAPPLGNIDISNRDGSVTLTLPEHAGFDVEAVTSNGSVENDFSLASSGDHEHRQLTGKVGDGSAHLHLVTRQGDIVLRKGAVAPLPPLPPPPPKLTAEPAASR